MIALPEFLCNLLLWKGLGCPILPGGPCVNNGWKDKIVLNSHAQLVLDFMLPYDVVLLLSYLKNYADNINALKYLHYEVCEEFKAHGRRRGSFESHGGRKYE